MIVTLNKEVGEVLHYYWDDKRKLGIRFKSNKCLLLNKGIFLGTFIFKELALREMQDNFQLYVEVSHSQAFCPFTDTLLSKEIISISKESASIAITYYAKSAYINANGNLYLQFIEHENYALPLLNEYLLESESLLPYQMRDTSDLVSITLQEAISVIKGEKGALAIRKSNHKRKAKGKRKIDNVPQTKQT